MLKIALRDFDKLYDLSLKIEMLTYLQYLTEFSEYDDETLQQISDQGKCYAKSYLLEMQCKTVKSLKNLIDDENFANPIEKPENIPL